MNDVGEIERRPVRQIEEVGDVPEPDPVDEVRHAATQHEAERDGHQRVSLTGAREEDHHRQHRDPGDHHHRSGRVREQTERDTGVADVVDRERPRHLPLVTERERSCDRALGDLVCDHRSGRDRDQRQPLRAPGRERPLRARDGLEGVRGRADAGCRAVAAGWRRSGSPALLLALVLDAQRRVRHRVESLLRDRVAAHGARARSCRPRSPRAPRRSRAGRDRRSRRCVSSSSRSSISEAWSARCWSPVAELISAPPSSSACSSVAASESCCRSTRSSCLRRSRSIVILEPFHMRPRVEPPPRRR